MKRWVVMILGLVTIAAGLKAQEAGFFLDDWQEQTAALPDYDMGQKVTAAASVSVAVDPDSVINWVPKYIFGNNAIDWHGNLNSNAILIEDLNNLEPHVLRWPGGNLSNQYFWNRNWGDYPEDVPPGMSFRYGMNTTWSMSVDQYYDLLENTGSTGLICVNYSYARYGTGPDPVANAAHMAAEWVRYDNGRSRYWEIGNENYGTWQAGYEIDTDLNQDGQPEIINGKLYGQHCRVFLDSMRKAAAEIGVEIKIGVVVYDDESSHASVSEVWNEGVMPEVGHLADFLAVHNYYGPYGSNSGVPVILNTHHRAGEIMEVLKADMAEAGQDMIPVAMTEWNIWAEGSMQQVSYINGIHAAQILGEYIRHGYGMSNRWDIANSWNDGDDHGMFSSGGEPGVDAFNPRPVFFYMYYFQKYFGDRMVSSVVNGSEDVMAWASTFSSGEMGLVLINKGKMGETIEIDAGGFDAGPRYRTMTLTGGEDNGDFSRKVFLNGQGTDEAGGGPDHYEEVRAIAYGCQGGIRVDLPGLSVVYVMVEAKGAFTAVSAGMDNNPSILHLELSEAIRDQDEPAGFHLETSLGEAIGVSRTAGNPDFPWILDLHLERDIGAGEDLRLSYSGTAHESTGGQLLPPFNEMKVNNRLPAGPFEVSITLLSSASGQALEGCQVQLGDSLVFSDPDGRAMLNMLEGNYSLSASGLHLDTLVQPCGVEGDMDLSLEMDSTLYELEFSISDFLSGDMLSGVLIAGPGAGEALTGSEGSALFHVNAASRTWSFSKLNYAGTQRSLEVISDTTFRLTLEQTHASVKFRLRSGSQPVNGALVELGDQSAESDNLGRAIFSSMALNKELDYTISREDYYSKEGKLLLSGDSTLEVSMERSVANLHFRVYGTDDPLSGASVVIGEDSLLTDAAGGCTFYKLPRETAHAYRVGAAGYAERTGELELTGDSLVEVVLQPLGLAELPASGLRIWPNPSSGKVFLESDADRITGFSLVDARGRVVLEREFSRALKQSELEVSNGLYFLLVRLEGEVVVRTLVVH